MLTSFVYVTVICRVFFNAETGEASGREPDSQGLEAGDQYVYS